MSKADNEGWRKGQGAYSKEVKLNRNSPWDATPSTRDLNAAAAAAKKYNASDDAGLRNKLPEEATASPRDVFDNVEKNQLGGKTGPVKYGTD